MNFPVNFWCRKAFYAFRLTKTLDSTRFNLATTRASEVMLHEMVWHKQLAQFIVIGIVSSEVLGLKISGKTRSMLPQMLIASTTVLLKEWLATC